MRDLFFDLDNTLFDFDTAEHIALHKALREVGIEPTEELVKRYGEINRSLWEMLERGEIERDKLLVERFSLTFAEFGLPFKGSDCEGLYRKYLGIGHYYVNGALDILRYLAPKYRLHLATNGVAEIQRSRMAGSELERYMTSVFISEETGFNKPEQGFFDYCFAHIPDFELSEAMMIGDTLSSDILGGIRAGLKTCWFNPKHRAGRADVKPDWEIHTLAELKTIL